MDDFYLFANCNFVPDRYNDWQAAYDDLAKYVYSSEHTTKTYYFGIPLDYAHDFSKTTSMLAFEIYGTREDLYGPTGHLSSPAMSIFLTRIPAASTTGLDLNHYSAVSGFLDLHGDQRECHIMQDVKITCVSPAARTSLLTSLSTLVSSVEKQQRENVGAEGVLTYMCFKSLDDEVGARVFGRWATGEDMEGFIRRDDVKAFWEGNKENVRAMEQRGYRPNGKGWLHRGKGYAGETAK
ncbi:hypothetical protein EJ04DRAFT_558140 [Polyplosphaeria fusca]|uniref:ABM domain-containing protein n=1 Tax=Polyplosphaeria fusca TaxID=682080 RepID=A0A9P4RDA6_9PLEO|nr:hypothetical protein EJ04DRAFT_558140 [Polyplosphaeria fusca]